MTTTQNTPINATKERLFESALTLFSTKGYAGTSVREIIEAAGVTRPVLYYYFKSKEDLYHHLVVTLFQQYIEETDQILADETTMRGRLLALMKNAFESVTNEPEAVRFLLQVFFTPPEETAFEDRVSVWAEHFMRIVRVMREALDSGELSGGNPETLALAFCASMDYCVMLKSHEPRVCLTDEFAEAQVDLFLLGAQGGRGNDITPFGYSPNPLTMPHPLHNQPGKRGNQESA